MSPILSTMTRRRCLTLPPPSCPGLCTDPDAENYNPLDAAALTLANAAAIENVTDITGRAGICPTASRWCVPKVCRPCRCTSQCGHDVLLELCGRPATAPCCGPDGEPLDGAPFAPFTVWFNGVEVPESEYRVIGDHLSISSAYTSAGTLGQWITGKPELDDDGGWVAPPADSGLVVAGFYGECPTAMDILLINQLACKYALKLTGDCKNDEKLASAITQQGPDGSVTYRFDQSDLADQLLKGAKANASKSSPGAVFLTGNAATIESQHCDVTV